MTIQSCIHQKDVRENLHPQNLKACAKPFIEIKLCKTKPVNQFTNRDYFVKAKCPRCSK